MELIPDDNKVCQTCTYCHENKIYKYDSFGESCHIGSQFRCFFLSPKIVLLEEYKACERWIRNE